MFAFPARWYGGAHAFLVVDSRAGVRVLVVDFAVIVSKKHGKRVERKRFFFLPGQYG
jgi:hypothetical protein